MKMLLISALGGTAVLADGSAVSATPTIPSGVAIALGGLFSASTLVAIVTLVRDVLIERGKRKDAKESAAVVAQKDVREGESIREGEYRNLAEQARKSAETAVQVIKASLDATQGVVTQLQAVIESQNRTIATLTAAQGESSELLAAAREDRDRTQHALSVAEAKGRHEQRERIRLEAELATKEQDLALLDDLLYASVIAHPHRPTTGPIPTSKEHA